MRIAVLILGLAAVTAACSDANAPAARVQRRIDGIQVPAQAGAGDTIKISFTYEWSPCDTALVVESQVRVVEIRFAVTAAARNPECAIPYVVLNIYRPPFVYLVPPGHAVPYTVRFAEPGGADSVRVVSPPTVGPL